MRRKTATTLALIGASLCSSASAAGLSAQDTSAHKAVVLHPHFPTGLQVAGTAKVLSSGQISALLGTGTRPVMIRRAESPQLVPLPALGANLRVGDLVATRVADRAVLSPRAGNAAASAWRLPFRLLTLSATGETRVLSIWAPRAVLQYDGGSSTFTGWVQLYLVDSLHPGAQDTLPTPVDLVATAAPAAVAPRTLRIPRVNLPPESLRVSLKGSRDTVRLQLATSLDPTGVVDIPIPVEHLGLISLEPVPRSIRGFGLEETTIRVTLPEEAGSNPRTVRLSAVRSTPTPNTLTMSGGDTKSVTIRSVGVGVDTVTAAAGSSFASAPLPVRYAAPWLFFVTALLGGLAGSEMSGFRARRKGRSTSRLGYVASGLTTGVFVAVAFAIGLNFTSVEILVHTGEAVVFVVAALGALIGLPGLAKAIPALDRALHSGGGRAGSA
jgi:hypothetical protein